MRQVVAVLSFAFLLVTVLAARSAPAAERADAHEVLACKGSGAACDSGGDCCSKNCCSVNNHNKCVSASASQHLSCR